MKPLIAICSQDAELYLLLSHILEVDGFTSALAGSVEEAMELATDQPVQAVVLDCRPDNQFAAGSARLKQDARTSALPCIALVSSGAADQHIQLLKSGIDERFARPIAPAKLLEYLRLRLAVGETSGPASPSGKSLLYSDVEMHIDTY
ncbi:MAG: DNA-binding response regulator, partial [Mesorhizobium sp.]